MDQLKINRLLFIFFTWLLVCMAQADTMENYLNIANNIPQMEMKADPNAQLWAKSARNVLIIAEESIAETIVQANELARSKGKALFCLPAGLTLNAETLNNIIRETFQAISSQQSDKQKMTVSQVAWLGVIKKYPCV